jgi:hypothetical protein
MVSDRPKRAREAALGFDTSIGAGGVVGVIAGDFLTGTHYEPERYLGCFEIFPNDLQSQEKYSKEWKIEEKLETNNNGWNEVMSSKLNTPAPVKKMEVPRKAVLKFSERVMYRTTNLLNITFEEAPQEELMTKVSDQYVNLQVNKGLLILD